MQTAVLTRATLSYAFHRCPICGSYHETPAQTFTGPYAAEAYHALHEFQSRERAERFQAEWDRLLRQLEERERALYQRGGPRFGTAPFRTFPSTDRALYQEHTTEQRAPRMTLSGLRLRCVKPRARERRPMRSRPGTKRRTSHAL